MLDHLEMAAIMSLFGLTFQQLTKVSDTSRSEKDKRFNYILDNRYVLKVHSACAMWEERLQEINRLIMRYRSIGVYCPALIPALAGSLSCQWEKKGEKYICYVEEYAKYPLYELDAAYDRREVVEHLGVLAAKYSGMDLSQTRSMWSIIDLAPLDVDIDEKQENTNTLVNALCSNGHPALAKRLERYNHMLREQILRVFDDLPRCVFQGDLNMTNLLHDHGRFAGLIDFNLSGTDVNINVFLNETNWFPEEQEFDKMSVQEMVSVMENIQAEQLSVIFQHYSLNHVEQFAFPYYQRIVALFQYPNVCAMVKWLKEEGRRERCVELIQAMMDKPLHKTGI